MSWLHFHGKRPAVDEDGNETGELEDYEDDIEITGAARVQAMTVQGFQTHELSVDGLTLVEVTDKAPTEAKETKKGTEETKKGTEEPKKSTAKAESKS